MKKKLSIAAVLVVCILGTVFPQSTLAHSIKGTVLGDESIGWVPLEDSHTNGTTLYYKLKSDDPYIKNYKQMVSDGAALWTGIVTIKASDTAICTIMTYSDDDGNNAITWHRKTDSKGHTTELIIYINRSRYANPTKFTLAHEFGHAIGLNDLKWSTNKDKLMYYSASRTAKKPTEADINGVKYITGVHSAHTWGYQYYPSKSMTRQHQRYCTVCKGLTSEVQSCTYVKDICTKCKMSKGVTPYLTYEVQ